MKKSAIVFAILGAISFGASLMFEDSNLTELACGFGSSNACTAIGIHRVLVALGVILLLIGAALFIAVSMRAKQS
ncbi:MAG TPA: hypothetical protein VH591_21585 [Ktedonobacterales bacterium]|jgi:hypothetical protein